jgi:hypothetical protein
LNKISFVKNALISELEVQTFAELLPVKNADGMKNWIAAKGFQLPKRPKNLPYPGPGDFILLLTFKKPTLDNSSLKTTLAGVGQSIGGGEFATAVRR